MDNGRTLGWRRRRERRTTVRLCCEVMERRQLLSTLVVTNTNDDTNPHSLRWAILQADSGGGATIDFDIPASGPVTINLSSPLPALVNPAVIDGTSEPGYQGSPLIEIDGSALTGAGNNGLVLSAGSSMVQGLSIVGFSNAAIVLTTGGGNVIQANYLGVAPSGTQAIPNGQGLSLLGSSSNTIGNGAGGAGNVISGNTGNGILIQASGADASNNLISGNLIGTTADGTSALGNSLSGIAIDGASDNEIGSVGEVFGNVVSGNQGAGISLSGGAAGTQIQGNTIGLAKDGQTPLGNGGDGIQLDDAPGTVIGGIVSDAGNLISSNQEDGIDTSDGATGVWVAGNWIGTDPTGTLKLGNLGDGITLGSSSNTIGGTVGGATNVIAYNGTGRVGAGVELAGGVNHDLILSNSIYDNAGLGINLGSGPTPNHAPGTAGPNDYQNYPVLSLAQSDGSQTTVQGTLYESPTSTYFIQFFASPTPDPTGYGQGKFLIGSQSVQTDAKGNASFAISLTTAALPGQFISATATNLSNDTSEFSADVTVQGQINLQLSALATPNPVLAGGNVTYTLTVANLGYAEADNVVLTDQLPSSVTLASVSTSQGYTVPISSPGLVEVNLETLAAGASATVTIVVQTGAGSVGSITDSATITSQQTDPTPSLESATVTTTVQAAADVSVSLSESPSPALVGNDLTYTITVDNQGPDAAGNVVATLPVSSGLSFVSATTGAGTVADEDGQVVATLGNLGVNAPVTVTVVLQAQTTGELTETASVSSQADDPNTANNSASVTTEVDPATDLAVVIASSTPVAATAEPFDYVVTITNNGPMAATNVVASDTLPTGVSFVSVATGQGVIPSQAGGVVSATFGNLAVGASANLTIVVNPTALPGAILTDSASVDGQPTDIDPSNNTATLDTPVRGVSDLAIVATGRPGSVDVGQPLTYTITVSNQGPADEPDAMVTGSLPPGMTVSSATSSQGTAPTVIQGTLTADLGLLPANPSQPATITLIVVPGIASVGTQTASFMVQGQDYEPDPSNNSAHVTTTIAPVTELSVVIAPGPHPAIAQTDWTYTLTVSNAGPSDATGVIATSALPAAVQFVSASSSQGSNPTELDGTISANMGDLPAGGTATVTVVVQPTPAAAADGSMVLSAAVAGDETDPDPDNTQTSLTVPVAPSVTLAVTLASMKQTVESGQTITFTATVSNLGATPATNVAVTLPPVTGLTYESSTASQGSVILVANQLFGRFGGLDPGGSATLTVIELATVPGTFTLPASLTDTEYNLDPQGASTSATVQVLESPGTVQFAAGNVSVSNLSGVAVLPVDRLYGASGSITVHYQTIAVNATPGVDYVPTSGTLTLGPGQTSASIQVPVLDDLYENHDNTVDVVLDSPSGGALLGGMSTTALQIVDTDPDVTPPEVAGLTWTGSSAPSRA